MSDFYSRLIAVSYTSAFIILLLAISVFFVKKYIDIRIKCEKSHLKIGKQSNACGVILGKIFKDYVVYSPYYSEDHVAIYGGSGSGKTSAVIIPTLRSISRYFDLATFFAIDISGDISSNVYGMNIISFDPTDALSGISFDIFSTIRTLQAEGLTHEVNDALIDISYELIPDISGDSNGKWFADSGRDILKAALIAFQDYEFVDICEKIISSDYSSLFREIDELSQDGKKYINQFYGMSEKNISGAYQSACQAVSIFSSPIIANSLRPSKHTISPETLEHSSIFFKVSERELEKYAPVIELITSRIMFYLARRTNTRKKIFLVLDEYAALKHLDISGPLARLRKRGVRIMIVLQSIAQLDGNFASTTRKSIMDNCGINAIFGVEDPELQDYFSKKSGTVVDVRRSSSQGYLNTSYTEYDRPRMKPTDFGKLSKQMVIISHGQIIKLLKNYYYK